ncbi:MAG: TolC family protein [Acidobacteria bacterium]|nr:TolC family protein [Acidobacteriota bacterium]
MQGGNNPVYVFSSLLTQRQFREPNFAINSLVRPDPVANFQSQIGIDQVLHDFGRTDSRIKEAQIGREMTAQERRRRELEILTQTARAYFGGQLAAAAMKAAESSIASISATLEQAKSLRAAGRATDADVLAVEVEMAGAREELIRRTQQQALAMAALNNAMGQSIETMHTLTTALAAPPAAPGAIQIDRPEIRGTELAFAMATTRGDQAKAMRRPEVGVRFIAEADRQRFVTRGAANWFAAATLRWNLFDGGQSKEMAAEAASAAASAREDGKAMRSAAELQVKQADAAIAGAIARENVTGAITEQARETVRILRNRYGAGLATVTDVLRAEAALLGAETRRLAAIHDHRVARIEREAAARRLTGDSNELR